MAKPFQSSLESARAFAKGKERWLLVALAVALAGGVLAWQRLASSALPAGIASGNGRIEAVDIDIATKTAGRLKEILVGEGEFVRAGQVLASMDILVLEAQKREAEAQLKRAVIGVESAKAQVVQRKAEHQAAVAVVAQRKAEQAANVSRFARSDELASKQITSQQVLDDNRAKMESGKAAILAAEAQVAAAQAAISAAESAVINAEAAIEAAKATIERLQADIDDSTLKSPRDGRVQYRVAQPGEVLAAGGRVLNLVDLGEVHMTFFLPTAQAGRLAIGSEVRLVLDAAPQLIIPARVSFVADVAQFTPKSVETTEERLKLMFRVKAQIPPELLRKHIQQVKTGLPGMAYVQLQPDATWPTSLKGTLVQ
jgi:HlyD family secretion protein